MSRRGVTFGITLIVVVIAGIMLLEVITGRAMVTEVETDRLVCGVLGSSAISCVPKVPGLFGELDR